MRVDEIMIPEPCHEDWDAMDPRERGRFCRSCRKKVHNLSSMTEREARDLMDSDDDICVAYFEQEGRVAFKPEPVVPISRLRPRPSAGPAAAGLALALVACAPHSDAPAHTTAEDPVEVMLPLRPIIPEAQVPTDPEPPPAVEPVTEDEPAAQEVEPCDTTADPTTPAVRPIKGRRRIGNPARRRPEPTMGLLIE